MQKQLKQEIVNFSKQIKTYDSLQKKLVSKIL